MDQYGIKSDGLNGLGLISTHFSHAELACRHCGVNGCTYLLLESLERLRLEVGRPIIINDAFRCVEHNRKVGGVADSQHLYGTAADIHVLDMSVGDLVRHASVIDTITGIGKDSIKGYVHIDARPQHGFEGKVLWTYNSQGTPHTVGVFSKVPESFMV